MLLGLLNGSNTEVLIHKTWKARGGTTEVVFTLMLRDSLNPDQVSVNYITEDVRFPGVLHRLNFKYGDGIWARITSQDLLQLATTIKIKKAIF
ncbi:hypothetical protein QKW35_17615 [Pontibacterium granulatum]|uniref:hypothetical protein n=1 Tax=Pontibacterium granulatum TaxID=2036029 RepID=UPI00249CB0CE|nr:hypothetical protein [Pontibacterium granulatum]MDI3326202.1 hypothetical protein [Pontibacterium granulatum]